jgi:hypothetical protein
LFVNGYKLEINDRLNNGQTNYLQCRSGMMASLESEHAFLFDLKLEEQIKFEFEMDKAPLRNEWIHVKLKLTIDDMMEDDFREDEIHVKLITDVVISFTKEDDFREDEIQILRSVQMGIHVLEEKSNTEENVIFTNPYRKAKIDGSWSFRD